MSAVKIMELATSSPHAAHTRSGYHNAAVDFKKVRKGLFHLEHFQDVSASDARG